VVVDPGDPGEAATNNILGALEARSARAHAIALTHADPDHAAGALGLAERLAVPVLVGPGGGHDLPYDVVEVGDTESIDVADVPIVALATPGHRADHVAYVVDAAEGRSVVSGDLVGEPARRTVVGPPDRAAWLASLARLSALGAEVLLPGHGESIRGESNVAEALSEGARRAGSGGSSGRPARRTPARTAPA
jgi:glyoxylase-like metal-dependent hydrolase (beta-lactamase superfamily II)